MSACAASTDGGRIFTDLGCLDAMPVFWEALKIRADPSHPCDSGRNLKNLCAYKFIPNPSWISIGFMHTDFLSACAGSTDGGRIFTDILSKVFGAFFRAGMRCVLSMWGNCCGLTLGGGEGGTTELRQGANDKKRL